jgi:hypothetical protein
VARADTDDTRRETTIGREKYIVSMLELGRIVHRVVLDRCFCLIPGIFETMATALTHEKSGETLEDLASVGVKDGVD